MKIAERVTEEDAMLFNTQFMGSRFVGHILFVSAQVYDWLYKQDIITTFTEQAAGLSAKEHSLLLFI